MGQQLYHIPPLLKQEELTEIEQLIATSAFIDGKSKALLAAKEVKNNQQLENGVTGHLEKIQTILSQAIAASPFVQAAARPKPVHSFIISKYSKDNSYGWHVDSPIMGNPAIRTHMAMTIFLSDPINMKEESY